MKSPRSLAGSFAFLLVASGDAFAKGLSHSTSVDWFSFPWVLLPLAFVCGWLSEVIKNPKRMIPASLAVVVTFGSYLGVIFYVIRHDYGVLGYFLGLGLVAAVAALCLKLFGKYLEDEKR